jgi:hypothetical protein
MKGHDGNRGTFNDRLQFNIHLVVMTVGSLSNRTLNVRDTECTIRFI